MVPLSRRVTYRGTGDSGDLRVAWREVYSRIAIAASGASVLAAAVLIAMRMQGVW